MSRIKEIKNSPTNQVNFVKILSVIGGKDKYTELLLRIIKKTPQLDKFIVNFKREIKLKYEIEGEITDDLNNLEWITLFSLIRSTLNEDDLKNFVKYKSYNERKLIKNNDLQQISEFASINQEVLNTELLSKDKDLEKERILLNKTELWTTILPLTYESSKKYGASTRWCTASESTRAQFDSYTRRGVLIYNISNTTNDKVATFMDVNDREVSFWDIVDKRCDSMETSLDIDTIKFIKDYLKNPKVKPNSKMGNKKPGLKINRETEH